MLLALSFISQPGMSKPSYSLRCVHAQEIIEVLKEDRSLSKKSKAGIIKGVLANSPSTCKFNHG